MMNQLSKDDRFPVTLRNPPATPGRLLAGALSAVLDAVTGESPAAAVDRALRGLHGVASSHGIDLDTAAVAPAALHAAGRTQERRRRELALLSLYQATADLGRRDTVARLSDAILSAASRLAAPVDAAWLVVGNSSDGWRGYAASGLTVPDALRVVGRAGGMAAVAVRSAVPFAVPSYLDSTLFPHDASADAAIRQDRIGPVLAVQLPVTGANKVVLHLARRDATPFAAQHMAVLSHFAHVAAGQLEVVDALTASRRHAGELAGRLGDRDRSTAMIDELLQLVAAAEPPEPAIALTIIGKALGTPVVLLGPYGQMLAGSAPDGFPVAGSDLINRAAAAPGRVVVECGSVTRYAISVTGSGRSQGTLMTVRDTPFSEDGLADLRRAAAVLGALLTRRSALRQAYEEVRADLFAELLGAHRALPRSVRVMAEANNFGLDRPHVLVALTAADGAVLDPLVADSAALLGGIGGLHEGIHLALLPGTDPRRAADALASRIRRVIGARPFICVSEPLTPAGGRLSDTVQAVRHGLALLKVAGAPGAAATTSELALFRPLFDPDRADDIRDLLDSTLSPLVDYDREHNVDLVSTVRAFLATGGNAAAAARKLYIHPNTMSKRLERISRLLGDDWSEGINGLRLRLAIHLESLSRRPDPAPAGRTAA
ncbi:PucR family transcriptional regulator [Paractinoplanes brasiliensis]|uniref:PucR-like helix-turn-helix protein n=1 Tax=Paractinoplanes brasiliensis TaxID=52695 RepID=A0A4V6PST5_9ACTN|nr:PucR family transcriptional regulator [Actinoplanes brasiliensis]TDO36628.1 PucR-like helix-turn-helix protein [Actinoplanes brasiliensis]GID32404.1 cyclic diguanylate phosphodiesterase [Actinoplanes brasiliensis]